MSSVQTRSTSIRGFQAVGALLWGGVVGLAVGGCGQRPSADTPQASQSAAPTAAQSSVPVELPDPLVPASNTPTIPPPSPNDNSAQILGQWKDEFYGERTLTFRDDGTGTMRIRLDTLSRLLYGDEVSIEFAWKLDGDHLHFSMLSGQPEKTAETLSQLFGKTSDKRIEKLDEREMHLRSLDSQKLYIHRRQ